MKYIFAIISLFAATTAAFGQAKAPVQTPGKKAEAVIPAELVAARGKYQAALSPIRAKVAAQIKSRSEGYVAQLKQLELREASAGHTDAADAIRREKEAYSNGGGTAGFDTENKKIPAAARDIRRTYDRDVLAFTAAAVPLARPLTDAYLAELAKLEFSFSQARNTDGLLAVSLEKNETKSTAANPLAGDDKSLIGNWAEADGFTMMFHADGLFTTARPVKGTWEWTNRAKNQFKATFEQWKATYNFEMTPDGLGISGSAPGQKTKNLSRVKQ